MIPKLSIFFCCRILTLAYLPDMKVLRITLLLRTYLPHYNRATIALSYGTSCRLCYIDGNFCLLSYGVVNFQHFHYIESLDQISLAIHQALYTFTVTALSLFELTVCTFLSRVCQHLLHLYCFRLIDYLCPHQFTQKKCPYITYCLYRYADFSEATFNLIYNFVFSKQPS